MKKYLISFIVIAVLLVVSSTITYAAKGGDPFQAVWNVIADLQAQITNIQLIPGPTGSPGPQGPAGSPSWDEQRIASLENRVANLEQKLNNPVIIDFNDWATGDYGNSLKHDAITIATYPSSHLEVTDQTGVTYGYGNVYSIPNQLSVWGEQPWLYKEQTSFSLQFDYPVYNFSFWITGTFHDTTVVAYDKNGNVLETFVQTYPIDWNIPSPDGSPWDAYYDRVLRFIQLNASGISKITIQPSGYDGFSIDDLTYSL
jgi:hypothetical protein